MSGLFNGWSNFSKRRNAASGDQGPAWKGAKKAGIEVSLSAWNLQGEVLGAVAAVMLFMALFGKERE